MSLLDENATATEPLASVPDPPAESETTPEGEKGTEYVVFKMIDPPELGGIDGEVWEKIGVGRGSYAGVIKEIAGGVEGVYSAAPTRSWRPGRLGVKTEVTLSEL